MLSNKQIDSIISKTKAGKRKPQAHGDGGGLYLQAQTTGVSWLFRFTWHGVRRNMGLGPYPAIGLAEARAKAQEQASLVARGIDPVKHRDALRAQQKATLEMTFQAAAKRYFEEHSAEWRSSKTNWLYEHLMETHAYPVIGKMPIAAIGLDDALRVLRPAWKTTNFSARRLMFWCRAVIDATRGGAGGIAIDRLNPFAWGGNLKHRLANPSRIAVVKHHKALDWKQMPSFMAMLRDDAGTDARMLELCILCATRAGALLQMQWQEIDFHDATWSVPREHEKSFEPLRVPLSDRALAILTAQRPAHVWPDDLVWASERTGGLRSPSTLWCVVRRLGYTCSEHGFRSAFADWRAETTNFGFDLAEAALSHTLGQTMRSYQRGDLFDKRRALMAAWGSFCAGDDDQGGNVVKIGRAA